MTLTSYPSRVLLVLLLGAFCGPMVLEAQPIQPASDYALIFPNTGPGISGTIVRIERDSIVVYDNDLKWFAKKDIHKIVLHPRKDPGKGFITGTLWTTYAANYLFAKADGQPAGFLASSIYGSSKYSYYHYDSYNPYSILGIILFGTLLGGGIGFATDQSNPEDMVFLFPAANTEEQWSYVQDMIEHRRNHRKNHISTSGGYVFSSVQNRYYDVFTSNGLSVNDYYGSGSLFTAGVQSPTDFNWIRSVSYSHTFFPNIDIGVEAAWFGEPSYTAATEQYTNGNRSSYQVFAAQRVDARGYYLTGSYRTFIDKDEEFEVVGTAGLGLAKVIFDLEGGIDSSSPSYRTIVDPVNLTKSYFSGMLGASISYYLYNTLSFGLSSQYFIAGSETIRAIPLANIPEQRVHFGNVDIGFTLSSHF